MCTAIDKTQANFNLRFQQQEALLNLAEHKQIVTNHAGKQFVLQVEAENVRQVFVIFCY